MRLKVIYIMILVALLFTTVIQFDFQVDILSNVTADTSINGTHITGDITWTLSNSPYFIEGNITIDEGVTLTIEPGVEILFNGYYRLFVNGTLNAVGTLSNIIRFNSNKTDPAPGDWDGIGTNLMGTGHVTIKYCNITYGHTAITLWGSSHNIV